MVTKARAQVARSTGTIAGGGETRTLGLVEARIERQHTSGHVFMHFCNSDVCFTRGVLATGNRTGNNRLNFELGRVRNFYIFSSMGGVLYYE